MTEHSDDDREEGESYPEWRRTRVPDLYLRAGYRDSGRDAHDPYRDRDTAPDAVCQECGVSIPSDRSKCTSCLRDEIESVDVDRTASERR